jgi:hypothetical protein
VPQEAFAFMQEDEEQGQALAADLAG